MFILGKKSKKNLEGVRKELVLVTSRAIEVTKVDFMVFEGLRSLTRQRRLVDSGASRTMKSRHLIGEAVDLVPLVDRKLRWDWPLCYIIADAMKEAAIMLRVPITWGGAWDTSLNEWDSSMEELVSDYVNRRRQAGLSAFIDGPHFQLTFSALY
jgi:peptidoglycan L-alanyl-D-glutamate endopeptidase CwlK